MIFSRYNSVAVTYDEQQDDAKSQFTASEVGLAKKGWSVRISMLALMSFFVGYNGYEIVQGRLALLSIYAIFALLVSGFIFIVGWLFFTAPTSTRVSSSARHKDGGIATRDELVSVIIPVYNQLALIERVLDAVYYSTYDNIEVIVVDDGSTDGTDAILDRLAREKYPRLVVFHKEKNAGKRKAVATGIIRGSRGEYIILIDSDSMIDKNAISEMMAAFAKDPRLGAIAGQGKVWNADKNHITKWQEVWYDFAFNIQKTCESYFGAVTCCSGCLAGYRREAISRLVEHWDANEMTTGDHAYQEQLARDERNFLCGQKPKNEIGITNIEEGDAVIASLIARDRLEKVSPFGGRNGLSKKLLCSMADYDDCEDGALTAYTLAKWDTAYVPGAIVHTEIPDNNRAYFRQQQRWKKGYLRAALFASTFVWRRKNPIMSLLFYTQLVSAFTLPVIISLIPLFILLGYYDVWTALTFVASILTIGLLKGVDYWIRSKMHRHFLYGPLMEFVSSFLLPWLILPALANYKKNKWLTR